MTIIISLLIAEISDRKNLDIREPLATHDTDWLKTLIIFTA